MVSVRLVYNMDFYLDISYVGKNLYVRGMKDGKEIRYKQEYVPSFYVLGDKNSTEHHSKYTNMYDEPLAEVKFDDTWKAREFITRNKRADKTESEIASTVDVYGNNRFEISYTNEIYPNEVPYDIEQISVGFIDIETMVSNGFPYPERAEEKVSVITFYHSIEKIYYTLTLDELGTVNLTNFDDVVHLPCKDEQELFYALFRILDAHPVAILTGWNIDSFDLLYLKNRAEKIFKNKDIVQWFSVWHNENLKTQDVISYNAMSETWNILGLSCLDYMKMYKKWTSGSRESYSLDSIANLELGEGKVSYTEFDTIQDFYQKDFQKFVEYNIQDVRVIVKLENKMNFIKIAQAVAYLTKDRFQSVLSPVKLWESIIYGHFLQQNRQYMINPIKNESSEYSGGYVKDPQIGRHEYIASFDLNSLYPSIIRQWNISPECLLSTEERNHLLENEDKRNQTNATIIKVCKDDLVESIINKSVDTTFLKDYDITMTAAGEFFRRDRKGFLAELVGNMYETRKTMKKEMLEFEKEAEAIKEELHKRGIKNV